MAMIGTGELTLAPLDGLLIERGNPQRADGGGSCAGGTIDVFAGGVGVTEQSATFFGRPWQPTSPPRIEANINPAIHAPRFFQRGATLRIHSPDASY